MSSSLSSIRRVGIVFAGGPAPAANAVISAAATSFMEQGCEVLGFFHGFSHLQGYHPTEAPLEADLHYRRFHEKDLRGTRNSQGIMIGTARANPGKGIAGPQDLDDPKKTARLQAVYQGLRSLDLDALITIGGDDTLKTANFLYEHQRRLPPEAPRVRVLHLPKTIDNDYQGIDFTFGFFTAVDFMAKEVQNLKWDAIATSSYFIVETMGRKAGWLSYGVGIAGEANLILGIEDLDEELSFPEEVRSLETGEEGVERRLDPQALADRICELIERRQERHGKAYGVVVLAEGLAEALPENFLQRVPRDEHGHVSLSKMNLGKYVAGLVAERYRQRTGKAKKIIGVQIGYEGRCAPPHAFDVMLGSQLGIGAFRALVEEGLDGHMVSVRGQLELQYLPFSDLVDGKTLRTKARFIEAGSDFHRLARFMETPRAPATEWTPGPRPEEA
jgi:6-phosphofructokinase 1